MIADVLTARLDAQGRLIDADAAFIALNARAGGDVGQVIAIPAFAAVARLARQLAVPVDRMLRIADGEADQDCRVTATPTAGGVALAATLLRERSAWRPTEHAVPPVPAGAQWTWETDAALRLTRIDARQGASAGLLGRPLTRLFLLVPQPDGSFPLLDAVAARSGFEEQAATIDGARVTLSARARLTPAGAFAGYAGATFAPPADAATRPATPSFGTRLERILRAPLGRIIADADDINAAADGPLEPLYADYAADIATAGRHLMTLLDDLVDIEAIERDDFTVASEPLDVAAIVRRAAGLFAVRAAEAGVEIDLSGAQTPQSAQGEPRRVLQILVNLIGNALRYSPRGGRIWLVVHRDADTVAAVVADQGRGIALADQPRIFEKFGRVDPAEPGGSGLGLYIARRLARAMHGELMVDSIPQRGARFVLTLPGVG